MNEQEHAAVAAGVPEGLPVLEVGRHRRPEHGACVMEYVSVLAGEPWSDAPECTDRALGDLARRVNDDVEPQARSALAEMSGDDYAGCVRCRCISRDHLDKHVLL